MDNDWWTESVRADDLRPVFCKEPRFRLTLVSDTTGACIGFPWWDRRGDANHFFEWLRTARRKESFLDSEQGWIFQAVRLGDRFHFIDYDPDRGQTRGNVSAQRDAFLAALYYADPETEEP